MPEESMFRHLLQSWIVAYEKAIVDTNFGQAKLTIDAASCKAVEDWTNRLKDKDLGKLEEKDTIGNSYETIESSINHHIDNLIQGGMWTNDERPQIEETEYGENVVKVTVKNCAYQKGCEWGLSVPEFREEGQYRCQRLGCFVGAIKKYMKDEKLDPSQKEILDYVMTTVMDAQEGCKCEGFIFLDKEDMRKRILQGHPTKLPDKSA